MMSAKPIVYLAKDFDAILNDLQIQAQAIFQKYGLKTWNDYLPSNHGVVNLEAFARAMEFLLYYQDRQANECFGSRAKIRKNIIALLKWIAYQMHTQKSATVTATITRPTPHTKNILMIDSDGVSPILAKTETDGAIFRATDTTKVLVAGANSIDIPFKHSRSEAEAFISNGTAKQTIKLSQTPFLHDNTTVVTVNGKTWTLKEHWLASKPEDKHYLISINGKGEGIAE